MKWNDDWRSELYYVNEDCFTRLCECRNTKKDLKTIFYFMYKYNTNKTVEEVLNRVIDWLTDWNGQIELIPTPEEYNELLKELKDSIYFIDK